ncbi:MAG: two-component system phosphate regulon sensor histidine kinase PhoR [Gammaproteobacteria bacterium]
MSRGWFEEAQRFSINGVFFLLIGLVTGEPLMVLLAAPWYLLRTLTDLHSVIVWMEMGQATPPPDVRGMAGRVASVWVAQRRQSGATLSKSEQRTARIEGALHALPDAIVDLDHQQRISWCNGTALGLLGIHLGRDNGQAIDNLIRHPDFIDLLHSDRYADTVSIASPSQPDRQLSIRLLRYGSDKTVLLARDETNAIRLTKVRQDFIANVSHELKNPLAVLSGYTEIMEDGFDELAPRWHRPVNVMSEQVSRMTQLVEDLLLLSRTESIDRPARNDPILIAELIPRIIEEANVSSANSHDIRVDISTDGILVGDHTELRAAFTNLVSNAIRHTPTGGRIDVRWHGDSQYLCFDVQDQGRGIDTIDIPRLTERFFRADAGRSREQGGTGLGLAIVKHVLQHYDATLEITSNLGAGSRFRCVFPRIALDSIQATAQARSPSESDVA